MGMQTALHKIRFSGWPYDPELLHAGFERGGIEVEDFGRALLTAHAPVGLLEHIDNMLPFHFFQRQCLPETSLADRLGKPFDRFQFRSFAQNHCALDHVFQFANVPRPLVTLERAVILSEGSELEPVEWLSQPVSKAGFGKTLTLEEMERQHIIEVLEQTNWRVSGEKGAAKILDLNPTTLEARMKKLGIVQPA